ncbi:MAG: SAM-dependent chlorinase/fluorinase [Bacteroidetes bacterium]|nr:SAM-dependent chlorinase/fluorinase [Bacteroidota bacterium]MCL2302843.1 SAM-dependent chlorinase/fluorinase [Lentimicrobiaceae bacterium]
MITLLSDWRLRDPYVGIFKGQLLNVLPNVQIIDITHHLELFNLSQTAFVAKNSYSFFPGKTLHIILSGLSFSNETKPVLLMHNGHFFLGEDTGVFSMMFGAGNNVEAYQYNGDMLLSATEKLACMASWVFQGIYVENTIPYPTLKFQLSSLSEPDYNAERKRISGKIAYIDSCCNAITNIPVSMFEAAGKRKFEAIISTARPLKITRCHPYYNPHEPEVFLVYNRLGFLEITLFKGNIAALADIKVGNNIEIDFS